jgi:DNA-directed RNA polymerase subunit beta
MASNMQRQAVSLLKPHAPTIGTGTEYKIAHDSGLSVVASENGTVDYVDSKKIVVGSKTYNLLKFNKSNQNTCINQTPIVSVGDKVQAGEIIANGPANEKGELAIGRNLLVAFTT